jgi:hypothetical protein
MSESVGRKRSSTTQSMRLASIARPSPATNATPSACSRGCRCGATARRATLAAAAGVGSLATILLAPPIESVFASLSAVSGVSSEVLTAAAVFVLLAAPAVWLFYIDRAD